MRAAGAKISWLCLGGTFAGGAFLATALFELGPEALGTLGTFPGLAMMLATGGFLFWLDRQGHHAHAEMHGCHPHGGSGVPAKPYILGGMLAFHSVLEGLALGLFTPARPKTLLVWPSLSTRQRTPLHWR